MAAIGDFTKKGQSIWYDYIERDFVKNGQLQSIVDKGVSGLTSNPTIFEQAVCHSDGYDDDIIRFSGNGLSAPEIYDKLSTDDIRAVAKILLPVYERTNGLDGYVSIEVSPYLAENSSDTVAEGIRLSKMIGCPNVMIKVPATIEGCKAIQGLLSQGINVNVTLIFGVSQYKRVLEAYFAGLENALEQGMDLSKISSVASFFISRVDTFVDNWLSTKNSGTAADGKIAIANSWWAYEYFENEFSSERFSRLKSQGANVQRLLWASTSTKNPKYDPLLYVKGLVAAQTVNTVAPKTLSYIFNQDIPIDVFCGRDKSHSLILSLKEQGLDMDFVADELLRQGLKGFINSYDVLIQEIQKKIESLLRK